MENLVGDIKMNESRLSWVDILKGIGVIFVIIGHVYINNTVFNWIYSFHMALFFFVAGYTYKERSVIQDIKRRLQTIVVPYFVFGLIILLYWQFIERRFRPSDMSFIDALVGLLSGEAQHLDFNIHLWFLPCFFVTVILFNALMNIGKWAGNRFNVWGGVQKSCVPYFGSVQHPVRNFKHYRESNTCYAMGN